MASLKIFNKLGSVETWIARGQLLWGLFSIPTVAAAMTALLGYIQGSEAMWIIPASAFAFASTAHGLLRYSEWRSRNAVEQMFDVFGIYSRQDCSWSKAGKPTKLEKINIGVNLANRAMFPMSYRIDAYRAIVQGRVANSARLEGKTITIPSGLVTSTHPDPIDVSDLRTLDVGGTIEIEGMYGAKDDLKFPFKRKFEFDLVIDKTQSLKPNALPRFAPRDIT